MMIKLVGVSNPDAKIHLGSSILLWIVQRKTAKIDIGVR